MRQTDLPSFRLLLPGVLPQRLVYPGSSLMVHFFLQTLLHGRQEMDRRSETWPPILDLTQISFSIAGSHASPGFVYNSVMIVDPTLQGAGTKWWVGCSPGSGLTAPATDARTVTRRGQGSPNRSVLSVDNAWVCLFSFPLASTSLSGKWG